MLREFPSQVFVPGNSNYTAIETSYWSLQEATLQPACIVVPQSTQDVSRIVSLNSHHGCPFAVKGNTHAPAAGFANIEHGVTIDMTGLQSLSLNKDHSVIRIGGGANWLHVYAFLDQYNLAVAGGRNGLVGVGGLTLGGGISHYAAREGFTCDNVVKFEVRRWFKSGHSDNLSWSLVPVSSRLTNLTSCFERSKVAATISGS